nr:PREDICTED: zinc finger protein 774-like [Linepithema humile]
MPYNNDWSNCLRCSGPTVATHSFPTKDCLVRHYRSRGDHHRGESRFRCIYCDYQSKYSSNVYKHVRRIHKHMPFFKPDLSRKNCRGSQFKEASEERGQRFVCPMCQSSFSKKGNMLTHYRYECGKEPRFQCPYCGKKDRKSSNTYRHIRTYHNGEKIHAYRLY